MTPPSEMAEFFVWITSNKLFEDFVLISNAQELDYQQLITLWISYLKFTSFECQMPPEVCAYDQFIGRTTNSYESFHPYFKNISMLYIHGFLRCTISTSQHIFCP